MLDLFNFFFLTWNFWCHLYSNFEMYLCLNWTVYLLNLEICFSLFYTMVKLFSTLFTYNFGWLVLSLSLYPLCTFLLIHAEWQFTSRAFCLPFKCMKVRCLLHGNLSCFMCHTIVSGYMPCCRQGSGEMANEMKGRLKHVLFRAETVPKAEGSSGWFGLCFPWLLGPLPACHRAQTA